MVAWLLSPYLLLTLLLSPEFRHGKGAAVATNLIKNIWSGVCGSAENEVHPIDYEEISLHSSISRNAGFNTEHEYQQIKGNQHSSQGSSSGISKEGESNQIIIERLKKELVKVRLNVVYDDSFLEEFSTPYDLENYVRNIIFATQFVFNQEELAEHVRINLVVVSLKRSEITYPKHVQSDVILSLFTKGPDIESSLRVDLNILLTFRNFWMMPRSRKIQRKLATHEDDKKNSLKFQAKVLGQAGIGTFCSRFYADGTLMITVPSLGSAVILAHELAHSFGTFHDGEGTSFERACNIDSYIMYPDIGETRLHWSPCTIARIRHEFISRAECIFNPARISSAKPLKPSFDFSPSANNPNFKLLPGQNMSIDAQCTQALGKNAKSSLSAFGRNGNERYDTCQSLVCTVGKYMEIGIGPAPAGSRCRQTSGHCLAGSCVAKS